VQFCKLEELAWCVLPNEPKSLFTRRDYPLAKSLTNSRKARTKSPRAKRHQNPVSETDRATERARGKIISKRKNSRQGSGIFLHRARPNFLQAGCKKIGFV